MAKRRQTRTRRQTRATTQSSVANQVLDALAPFGVTVPRNVAHGETEILIYGEIGFSFFGDSITAKEVADQLAEAPRDDTIVVRINSPGGDAFDGVAIGNLLRDDKRRVVVKIDGTAISAASIIAMAGDEIRMADNALMMIHDPWSFALGNAAEMRDTADMLDVVAKAIAQSYATQTGKPLAELRDLMADETWMNAEEALEEGFVTHIDGVSADEHEDDDDEDAEDVAASLQTLGPQHLARYQHMPAAAQQFVRPADDDDSPVKKITYRFAASGSGHVIEQMNQITTAAQRASEAVQAAKNHPSPPERGDTTSEEDMDLKEAKAALDTANNKLGEIERSRVELQSKVAALETQNATLATERDTVLERVSALERAAVKAEVEQLIGVKFTTEEVDHQIELAISNRPLFDKLTAQRTEMTLLNRDPARMGPEPQPERSEVTDNHGEGFADLVNAAANA